MSAHTPENEDKNFGPGSTAKSTRDAFEGGQLYPTATICTFADRESPEYTQRLLFEKLDTVRRHIQNGPMLDLCCATGDHIADLLAEGQQGIGIDFSLPFLQEARKKEMPGVTFLASDARALPLASESTGTVYSLSALYLVPDLDKVIKEIARILKPGGRCILDLGNRDSLNSYCVRNYYTELPTSYHLSVSEMERLCESNGLRVIEQRAFQILPLWAGRPRWLWPLLHPSWKRLMSRRIKGRMIDEWISGCKLLRRFAFRQLLVCEKPRHQENH